MTLVLSKLNAGLINTAWNQENFGRYQENDAIAQHVVDEIIQQEKEKLSVKDETHENIDDEVDEDDMYDIDKIILDEK